MMLTGLYSSWVAGDHLLVMSTSSAELTKIASNAMIAQRISSVHSLSAICEDAGATISDVTLACGFDPRIGAECLHAGLGFGRSFLKKDLLGLSEMAFNLNLSEVALYWEQVLRMNDFQCQRLLQRILSLFGDSLL
jgi:UDPglucose 6-dehydrogenase